MRNVSTMQDKLAQGLVIGYVKNTCSYSYLNNQCNVSISFVLLYFLTITINRSQCVLLIYNIYILRVVHFEAQISIHNI